jgi:hypothetical protein
MGLSRRGWEPTGGGVKAEAEGSPLLEAVTREGMMRKQQTEKLSDLHSVDVSDCAVIKCSPESSVKVVNKCNPNPFCSHTLVTIL